MIYEDDTLYKELLQILKACMKKTHCPVCGNDTRKRHDCKFCEHDHMGKCLRDGKHKDDCLLKKHSALVDFYENKMLIYM